jgi:hypothetical protein
LVGFQKNLLKVWDIMHRIYRNTVMPRVGNFDQIHGKLIDLLFESSTMVGQGKKLDVMDIIWHEMYAVVMKKRPSIFGAHIMQLIIHMWNRKKLPLDLLDNEEDPTEHKVKELSIKKHVAPLIPNEEESSSNDEDDPLFELPPKASAQDKSFKKWMASAVKTIFCRQDDADKRAYKEHVRNKKERQLTRQRFEHLGVPVQPGSEDRITSEAEWLKNRRPWVDFDFQDDASSSQPDIPWSRTQIGPSTAHVDPEATDDETEDDDTRDRDDGVGSDSAEKSDEIAPATTSDEDSVEG